LPDYEAVIGLEVHAQLSTRTKLFCGCSARFGAEPNTQVCPVCLGLPGALPTINRTAVEFAVRMGLATGCAIAPESIFARKNYFYPDCPKNYQISQYDTPLCAGGQVTVGDGRRKVRITRIHLEEDAGKLVHAEREAHSYVDMNRCGVPLIEIVSEPDIRTPAEASEYMQRLRTILRYLDICDGNMEEGSLRCDVNISLREAGSEALGVKTEVKNVNSFKFVEQALAFEIDRQTDILKGGGEVTQDTLLIVGPVDRTDAPRAPGRAPRQVCSAVRLARLRRRRADGGARGCRLFRGGRRENERPQNGEQLGHGRGTARAQRPLDRNQRRRRGKCSRKWRNRAARHPTSFPRGDWSRLRTTTRSAKRRPA
jgi:aspartyl-tRNA(Asn)/glutamyl-tRNA(Gln) amidotransferase subunit B